MIKIAAYLLLGIGVGLGVAYWQGAGSGDDGLGSALAINERAPLERRLSELETALELERYERQALAMEMAVLRDSMAAADAGDSDSEANGTPRQRVAALAENGELRERFEGRSRGQFPDGVPQTAAEREAFQRQRQLDRFVEVGFAPDRADWIMRREEELQMEVLQARYEATQNGASEQEVANLNMNGLLREELGDADYERYLEGRGRPTTINIREILTNSPAETAGLMAGDEIVAYNGQRVFEMNELSSLTNSLAPGETVPVEVLRDGQPVQVFVQSGPIGITGGGRSSRRGFGGR